MNFKYTISIIAIIIFFLSLFIIGYIVYKNKSDISGTSWAPLVSNCPDYWIDLKGDGSACQNIYGLGSCNKRTTLDLSNLVTNCDKYNWSIKNKLTWDGITNMNPSNCITSTASG
jgi:hypothetical protein